jgi:V/A-type H+-transporting ATPase subunit A
MTEVLEEFPTLEDPRTGAPLMERTVLIANTSNMPVAAREASIYTGITISEYYRDMGYDVLMLADSTSRWGEALREISGRLEEMPGERVIRLTWQRAWLNSTSVPGAWSAWEIRAEDAKQRIGSVTWLEQYRLPAATFRADDAKLHAGSRYLLGIDYSLSRRRHFPAIHWIPAIPVRLARLVWAGGSRLGRAHRRGHGFAPAQVELNEIVQLVGPDAWLRQKRAVLAAHGEDFAAVCLS